MPKTFMVKTHRRLPATSTPTRNSTSGLKSASCGVWTSGHLVQQTAKPLAQLTCVTSSRECETSYPVNSRQHNTLWSPYLDVIVGELLRYYCASGRNSLMKSVVSENRLCSLFETNAVCHLFEVATDVD